jgi:hypothetical protein
MKTTSASVCRAYLRALSIPNFKALSLATLILATASVTSLADTQRATALLKVPPVAVYQVVQGKSLAETLNQVAQRSGISFKIGIDLGSDTVTQNLAAQDWKEAVNNLLTDYNYSLIQEDNHIKSVIITGRKFSNNSVMANAPVSLTHSTGDNNIEFAPVYKVLPQKYRDLPAGSVTAVNIPVAQMLAITEQTTISLALPMGDFAVMHDSTVAGENGMQTWIGHLDNEGEGYRTYISQGPAGIMGVVNTPDGTYNIEQTAGNTYIIDTNKLTSAGFKGDQETVIPAALAGAITAQGSTTTSSTIAKLQATVTADQILLSAAQATVSKDQSLLTTANTNLSNALSAYNAANSAVSLARSQKSASSSILASATTSKANTLAAQNAALSAANAANTALSTATAAQTAAQTTFNALKTKQASDLASLNSLNAKLTAANTALANALSAKNTAAAKLSTDQVTAQTANADLTRATASKTNAAAALTSATSAKNSAQTALTTAKAAVTTAQGKLSSAKGTAVTSAETLLSSSNTTLTTVQNTYNIALANYTTAQGSVSATTSSYNTSLAAYNAANAVVAKDNTSVSTTTNTYNAAVTAANAAQVAVTTAQNTYNADVTSYNNANMALTNAIANVAANQSKYTSLTATYTSAVAAYNAAVNAYNAAVITANNAGNTLTAEDKVLVTASNAYNTAFTAVTAAQNVLTTAQKALTTAQNNYNAAVTALNNAQNPPTTPTNGSGTANNTIDIMVVYTTVAKTQAYMLQRIQLLTAMSNQAYIDSDINLAIRLVHTEPTSYTENNSNSQALMDLATGYGAFASIPAKRAQYGADLVYLFRPLYVNATGNCGLTYLEFASGSAANTALGYGTMGDGTGVDNANYYCGINTFTHEIGHSLGLVHDRADANGYGATPYSYAWSNEGVFATIMSYQTPMLMLFSTPLLTTQCAGQPCGYAATDATRSSDQSRVVNMTAPTIAAFEPTTTATPVLQ